MPEQVRSVHPFMRVLRTHPVIPAHSHEGVAEEGGFCQRGKQYRPGTSLYVKTGRLRGPHSTEKGCKLLVLGPAPAATQGQPSGSGGSIRAIRPLEKSGLNCRIF